MKRVLSVAALASVFMLAVVPTAFAHEDKKVGPLLVVVGWAEEPAVAGFKNAVSIRLTRDGNAVTNAKLKVQITAGGLTSEALTLERAFDDPGHYRATTIPTTPGTYKFHFTGTIGSTKFDQTFTSGPTTFHSPENPTELEFPERPPTRAELASLIERTGARAGTEADDAASKATFGLVLGAAGLVLGVIALLIALSKKRSVA